MALPKKIVIVAGEASGDMHAAALIEAIRDLDPSVQFFGLGGTKMQQAGARILCDLTKFAVVGFVEVIKHFSLFKKIFIDVLRAVDIENPDAAILVDYPGFNMRLAKELKKRNIKVIYYISPQVWAWGADRIEKIKRYVDKMIVILKFEEELYYTAGVDVSFVGHPLLDSVRPTKTKSQFLSEHNIPVDATVIALLPGSRQTEIQRLFPTMLAAARIIHQRIPNAHFIVAQSHTLAADIFRGYPNNTGFPLTVVEGETYNCINSSETVIVASGTATLETAILKKPMVIVYKISLWTWLILKGIVAIPYIGLVNVIAGKKIVPELVQFGCTPENIAIQTTAILSDKNRRTQIQSDLETVGNLLGPPGASRRAAQIIVEAISQKGFFVFLNSV